MRAGVIADGGMGGNEGGGGGSMAVVEDPANWVFGLKDVIDWALPLS